MDLTIFKMVHVYHHVRNIQNDRLKRVNSIKLMKGKAFGKHSLHGKTAASVLLKLFISRNESLFKPQLYSSSDHKLSRIISLIHNMHEAHSETLLFLQISYRRFKD